MDLSNETTEKLLKQQEDLRTVLKQTYDPDVSFTSRYFLNEISCELAKRNEQEKINEKTN